MLTPQTIHMALAYLNVLARVIEEGQTLFSRLHSGPELSDEEIATFIARANNAHHTIQNWRPAPGPAAGSIEENTGPAAGSAEGPAAGGIEENPVKLPPAGSDA